MSHCSPLELENQTLLRIADIAFGALRPSAVGLSKSILDATVTFRQFLKSAAIHDFGRQQAGSEYKVIIPAMLVLGDGDVVPSSASLYRPQTKHGDPRIWIQHLRDLAEPDDLVVCFWRNGQMWVANASRTGVDTALERAGMPLKSPKAQPRVTDPGVFEELLQKLKAVSAKGFIPAPVEADTAVGRLLESELGIRMNSAKEADYHGIEIKAARNASRRYTMFSQVPDWLHSPFVASSQILDAFGYERPTGRSLSCTLSVKNVNSRGLFLHVDRDFDVLRVRHNEFDPREVVQWDLKTLRRRIKSKHAETVWVDADVREVDGQEYLRFSALRHTKDPKLDTFTDLLLKGDITVDFLIRQDGDKGYPFKISKAELGSFFEHSKRYMLAR